MECPECKGEGTIVSVYLYSSCADSGYIVDREYVEQCYVCLGAGEVPDTLDDEE